MRRSVVVASIVLAATAAAPATSGAADRRAPGAPGARGHWTPADKHGFGTSAGTGSRVWFTLRQSTITEAYWPRIDTPAVRDLEFAVVDRGRATFESAARGRVTPLDDRSLSYRQTVTAPDGAWRLTKDVVTDEARDAVDVRVRLRSLRGGQPKLYALLDPALSNTPGDDTGGRDGRGLLASDDAGAVALQALFGLRPLTSAYKGRAGDPRRQLRRTGRLRRSPAAASTPGNVVQGARVRLRDGAATLALGFARTRGAASDVAAAALRRGFAGAREAFDDGWHAHLDELPAAPASVPADLRPAYDRSLLVLAASEDKTERGAGVASPSMPWAWGRLTIDKGPSGPYHLVWPRDLYQVGSAQLAAGDTAAANRAVDYLFGTQQKADGTFPQNSKTDGTPFWTSFQLDETALPIVLAWQAGRRDAETYRGVAKAADAIVARGPETEQERWENQSGWSPSTIAAAIAGLVCAGDIARANGDAARAEAWEATADEWRGKVDGWTATPNGPYSDRPYYLRVTKDGQPMKGTTYDGGDGGPGDVDQRRVVDQSFLELVRLGIKRADDPVVRNSLRVTDAKLAVDTPNGTMYHRFSFDGYGEWRDGRPWDLSDPGTFGTLGRAWPLLAGERGEYELLAGGTADAQLRTMAASANDGGMMPEQAWDGRSPTGEGSRAAGEGTQAATPLAWTHAQFVRLAWAIQDGGPVETPAVVARRYALAAP